MLNTPCSEVVRIVPATHFIRQFPLHSPPFSHRVSSRFNWSVPLEVSHSLTRTYTELAYKRCELVGHQLYVCSKNVSGGYGLKHTL